MSAGAANLRAMTKRLNLDETKIRELRAKGWTERAIAAEFGCSTTPIIRILGRDSAQRCKGCNGPLRADNVTGFCKRNDECRRAGIRVLASSRYARDSEQILERQRAARMAHPERWQEYVRRFKAEHPLYNVWCKMKERCNNPNCEKYPTHGGRAIKVCERWNGPKSYENFETDILATIGQRPDGVHKGGRMPLYTLDRIDNDANYSCSQCPECVANGWNWNVRWATIEQQNLNSRPQLAMTEVAQLRALLAERDAEIECLRTELAQLRHMLSLKDPAR
jgi:hypothetical protein